VKGFLSVVRAAWKTLKGMTAQPEAASGAAERYVIARCIGCGQCASGCPVMVKIKKR
jgi:ferredoxin